MQAKLPVLAVTDPNTDIGKVIVDGGFGWWCESSDVNVVLEIFDSIIKNNVQFIGDLGMEYLERSYNSTIVYKTIIKERIIR